MMGASPREADSGGTGDNSKLTAAEGRADIRAGTPVTERTSRPRQGPCYSLGELFLTERREAEGSCKGRCRVLRGCGRLRDRKSPV